MARSFQDDDFDEGEEDQTPKSNLSEDTFLVHVNKITAIEAKVKMLNEERKGIRKQAKAAGIELKLLDSVVRMSDWTKEEVESHFRDQARYSRWLRLPLASQRDLFEIKPANETDDTDVFGKGFRAGVMGLSPEVPSEYLGEEHATWMAGWQEGQKKIAFDNFGHRANAA